MSLPNVLLDRIGTVAKKRKAKPEPVTFPGAAKIKHAPDHTLREQIARECMKLKGGRAEVMVSLMSALSAVERGLNE